VSKAPYLLGVDGGGTKTVAVVGSGEGQVLGYGRAGRGDIYAVGSDALDEIERAVRDACAMADIGPERVGFGAFSVAGADWPEDFTYLQQSFVARGLARSATVTNDAIGALAAELPEGPGVIVVCGTGAATGARGGRGEAWHSSFWQQGQGSVDLGVQTLRAICRADLGIGDATSLTRRVLNHLGMESVEETLHQFTRRGGRPPEQLATLTPLLLDEADHADPVARRIVRRHGSALGDIAAAAARRVGILDQPFPLFLSGGVLRHSSPILRAAIVAQVKAVAAKARYEKSSSEPVLGALTMAMQASDGPPDANQLKRMRQTKPPDEFFATVESIAVSSEPTRDRSEYTQSRLGDA